MSIAGRQEHFAHFDLRRLLGRGGMGEVYEAWDTRLGRRVALKLMRPSLLASGLGDQVVREARAAARVEHPHVVRIYGIHEAEGQVGIEMEFVAGSPLRELMRAGALPLDQAVHLLEQVLEALEACHRAGIVHCDLKPGNVLVTPSSHVYLTDFGIACCLLGEAWQSSSPEWGEQAWGTPRYAAPEAASGQKPAPQWDLYAAGVMLRDVLQSYGSTAVAGRERLSEISPEFEALLDAMSARDPARRPASAAAALTLLRETPEFQSADEETSPWPVLPSAPAGEAQAPAPLLSPRLRRYRLAAGLAVLGVAGALFLLRPGVQPVEQQAASPAFGELLDSAAPTSEAPAPPPPLYQQRAPEGVVVKDNELYFSYDDGIHGRELWKYGHDTFRMADLRPGPLGSNPRFLWAYQTGVFLSAETDEHGAEPWQCTGEEDQRLQVAPLGDLNPGPVSSNPRAFFSHENLLLFYAQTHRYGMEPWVTLGMPDSTALVADLAPGFGHSAPLQPRCYSEGTNVWIVGLRDAEVGMALFRYEYATNSISQLVRVTADTGSMAVCGARLLIMNEDEAHGREPWVYDKRNGSFVLLKDLNPGPASSDPVGFFVFGEQVLFQARTSAEGLELYLSDGTAEGTALLADLNPGPGDSDPYGFTLCSGRAYFRARTEQHGRELWCTDGTAAGTALVADVWAGATSGEPYNLSTNGERMFFSANDGVHGEELWMAHWEEGAHQVSLVTDLWPGENSSEPHEMRWIADGRGYFVAYLPPGKADIVELRILPEGTFTRAVGLPEYITQDAGT